MKLRFDIYDELTDKEAFEIKIIVWEESFKNEEGVSHMDFLQDLFDSLDEFREHGLIIGYKTPLSVTV